LLPKAARADVPLYAQRGHRLGHVKVMNEGLTISIDEELLDAILEGARRLYPRETILLLRGKKERTP
jgi:hypothetical protein